MINVNLYNIISSSSVFTKMLNQEFNGKQAFIISRLLKAISEESAFFNKIREDMLKKYADKNTQGEYIVNNGVIQISEENKQKFTKELDELLNTSCSLNAEPIPFEWLEEIKLTPTELYLIEPFLLI